MRADMKSVIVDTGRHGKRDGARKTQPTKDLDKLECLPEREGMMKRWREGRWGWEFGDRLNPLEKFLKKNVGRPWNDVWSEICEHTDSRTIKGMHMRDHVQQYVTGSGGQEGLSHWGWRWDRFYVDDNGILREGEYRNRYRRQPNYDPDVCEINGHRFERINGCWFEVWYERAKKCETYVNWRTGKREYSYTYEDVKTCQRQLSKRELKNLGLSNDPDFKWWERG